MSEAGDVFEEKIERVRRTASAKFTWPHGPPKPDLTSSAEEGLAVELTRMLEDLLSTEPSMPSHERTLEEAERLLVRAKAELGLAE